MNAKQIAVWTAIIIAVGVFVSVICAAISRAFGLPY